MHKTFVALCSILLIISASAYGGTAPVPQTTPTSTPAPASKSANVVSSADSAARKKLQERLSALALAYNNGDLKAARKAMWGNHAVIRPSGDSLDREQLLAQWQKDWDSLKNRKMTLTVAQITKLEKSVEATWSLDLIADTEDAEGAIHKYRLSGTQRARYAQNGNEELLEGPIKFTHSSTTVDGKPWPPPG